MIWNVQDAKSKFSALVEAAFTGEAQYVQRRGKKIVVVVSVAEYEALKARAGAGGSFVDHLVSLAETPAGEL